jgi:ribosomal protein L11 methyltransferase
VSCVALRFDVEARDVERWSDALQEAGALAVDASDPRAGTAGETAVFAEPGEPERALWPVTRLCALFDRAVDVEAALRLAAHRAGLPPPPHATSRVADRDWVRASQSQFGPIRIDDGLFVVPTWCEPPRPDAVNIVLDPGVAFGTGAHPTTRLCLEWLRAYVTAGDRVLDYGCGSGILAIAAAKLGASRVTGTDVDPQALVASAGNARANGVFATFVAPDGIGPEAFDVVVANILAGPLVLLAPLLAARTRPGGRIALAGILDAQAAAVADAYARWFNIGKWRTCDGWSLLSGERRVPPDAAPC